MHTPATLEPSTTGYETLWWQDLLTGMVSIAIGVAVLVYPDPSLRLLGVFVGVDLLIAAGLLIVRGASRLAPDGSGQGELLLGILALIAGVLVIRNPGQTVVLMAVALAIYMIVAGSLALGRGIVRSDGRGATLAKGVLLIAGGTAIIAWPDLSRQTFATLAGLALLLIGATDAGEAWVLRSSRRRPA
jgi:hypothetical protein